MHRSKPGRISRTKRRDSRERTAILLVTSTLSTISGEPCMNFSRMKNERAGGRWLGRGWFVAKRNLREFRLSPGKSGWRRECRALDLHQRAPGLPDTGAFSGRNPWRASFRAVGGCHEHGTQLTQILVWGNRLPVFLRTCERPVCPHVSCPHVSPRFPSVPTFPSCSTSDHCGRITA